MCNYGLTLEDSASDLSVVASGCKDQGVALPVKVGIDSVVVKPGQLKRRKPASSTPATALASKDGSSFTWDDVAKHNTKEDAWIVVKDKVYDVTEFGKSHPGGRVIFEFAGRDATDVFSAFHSPHAWSLLRKHVVGQLKDASHEGAGFVADFRDLKAEFMREGLFKSSKLYYVWKLASTSGIILAAIGLLYLAPSSLLAFFVAAVAMGLGLQQAGWLSHDFCHNQVFNSRALNVALGYTTGNFMQGFSVYWWKHKHNTHHALPNQVTPGGEAPVDPDIDTLPFLAWSEEQLVAAKKRGDKHLGMLRYQDRLLWPLLLFARMSWCEQSVEYAVACFEESTLLGVVEVGLLAVHYGWLAGSACCLLGLMKGLAFVAAAQMFGGLFLGYVFIQSHNGMEVYSDNKDFATSQLVSTRDIAPGLWNDWFTGGLNYQIEHHLFPKMPRHNLGRTASRVRALCEKHDLPYESVGMIEATRRVVRHLAQVGSLV